MLSTTERRPTTGVLNRIAAGLLSASALALSTSALAGQSQTYFQAVNLQQFGNPDALMPGAVTLLRSRRQLSASIRASGLDPDAAYTAWWVVFNHPEDCATEPCTGADLRNPNVGGANFYATGFVTDGDGVGNIDARLRAGRLPQGVEFIDFGTGVRPRLDHGNGLRAEIHLVLRSHGARVTGWVAEQIGSGEFDGCETCANQQAAIFLPVR